MWDCQEIKKKSVKKKKGKWSFTLLCVNKGCNLCHPSHLLWSYHTNRVSDFDKIRTNENLIFHWKVMGKRIGSLGGFPCNQIGRAKTTEYSPLDCKGCEARSHGNRWVGAHAIGSYSDFDVYWVPWGVGACVYREWSSWYGQREALSQETNY